MPFVMSDELTHITSSLPPFYWHVQTSICGTTQARSRGNQNFQHPLPHSSLVWGVPHLPSGHLSGPPHSSRWFHIQGVTHTSLQRPHFFSRGQVLSVYGGDIWQVLPSKTLPYQEEEWQLLPFFCPCPRGPFCSSHGKPSFGDHFSGGSQGWPSRN